MRVRLAAVGVALLPQLWALLGNLILAEARSELIRASLAQRVCVAPWQPEETWEKPAWEAVLMGGVPVSELAPVGRATAGGCVQVHD